MSAIYDNWERLVAAVLKKEQLWQLFHADSVSVSSDSSSFSFPNSTSSLDNATYGWSASCIVAESLQIIENVNYTPRPTRVSSKVEVAELRVLGKKWGGDVEQRSYPQPLPPNSSGKSSSRGQERDEEIVESPRSPWKKGKLLGEGILGGIYYAFNNENGRMCAMRVVPLSSYGDIQQSTRIMERDSQLLSRMRHPNIVQYYGSEMVSNNFYVYYEYMSRGTLNMVLEQYGKLGEAVISNYTQQILSGLAYLHSKNIAHRGIKGANVLINPNGTVKLSNFGVENRIADRFRTSWMMDSPYWMAPEVIMNPNERNLAVDVWSLGCTVLEMATSKPPPSQFDGVACCKNFPTIPDHLSNACKDFIRHCLRWNPSHRATASQLLEHPFVKGFLPWADQILVSTSVTNSVKPEDTDQARNPHQQRNVLAPTFPVGSPLPLPLPRPPQKLGGQMCTLPDSALRTATSSSTLIGVTHLNQSRLHQHTYYNFPNQSPNVSSPCYWDPNILKGIFRCS